MEGTQQLSCLAVRLIDRRQADHGKEQNHCALRRPESSKPMQALMAAERRAFNEKVNKLWDSWPGKSFAKNHCGFQTRSALATLSITSDESKNGGTYGVNDGTRARAAYGVATSATTRMVA